jgi:hypothetical protein
LDEPLGADGNAIQRIAQNDQILAPSVGDDQALAFAIEELDAEPQLPTP